MAVFIEDLTAVRPTFNWTLLFVHQPDSDLELTEEELDHTITPNARGSVNRRKKSGGGSPMLWVLLLALVVGIAYAWMEPEMLTEWLKPSLGENTLTPMTMKPSAPSPAEPPLSAPQAAPRPRDGTSAPLGPPAPPSTAAPPASPAVVPQPQTAARPAVPVAPSLDPMFSEGQKVTVMVDSRARGENMPLFANSSSSRPGSIVRPGIVLTIMDGELQAGDWMYFVRGDEGIQGWISEKRIRLKF
ncbi:MAG: hypothetical protein H7Y39_02510 [Nitrospiraceae bacterium]|nr:hypothetical protein [Nitrospiraceae bacterium]